MTPEQEQQKLSEAAKLEWDREKGTSFFHGRRKCEHVWDGPEVAIENGMALTCIKCGRDALSVAIGE